MSSTAALAPVVLPLGMSWGREDVVAVCISCHQKRHWLDADEEERDVG